MKKIITMITLLASIGLSTSTNAQTQSWLWAKSAVLASSLLERFFPYRASQRARAYRTPRPIDVVILDAKSHCAVTWFGLIHKHEFVGKHQNLC